MQYSDTNPLIYFCDTSYKHIEYILQYAYVGEVSVEEKELKQFMKVLNKFKINWLYIEKTQKADLENIDLHREENTLPSIKYEEVKENFMGCESNMEVVDSPLSTSNAVVFDCDWCEYTKSTRVNLRVHKRSIHDGVKYTCNICDYKATQPGNLMQHKLSVHGGVKYPCDNCNYKATRPSWLNSHVRQIHKWIGNPRSMLSKGM